MLFLRSILSAVLEYGYYNSRGNAFETETRVVFIDSGFSHTSFAVVKFIHVAVRRSHHDQNQCVIEYLDSTQTVSGRYYLEEMMKATIGDNVDEVIESRKVYLRALDAFEKHLVTLNAPSACACHV